MPRGGECKKGKRGGSFKATQELMNVKGIGEKNYEKLQPFLSVGGGAETKAASK